MYRELQPFREALSQELKASLFPAVAGVHANKLLESYLDRPTMYTGADVAVQTFTLLAPDASREILGLLDGRANDKGGFQLSVTRARTLGDQHCLRIIAIAGETTSIYHRGLWDFLGKQPSIARVLCNPSPRSTCVGAIAVASPSSILLILDPSQRAMANAA